jgi:membrane-associated phospholipid phosphatase
MFVTQKQDSLPKAGRQSLLSLPCLLGNSSKYWMGLLIVMFNMILYSMTNHNSLKSLTFLNPSTLDHAIPLIPWTVWVYISYPLLFLFVYVHEKDRGALSRYLYAALAINLVSELIFICWPTAVDRTLFPLPQHFESLSLNLMKQVRSVDEAGNCFPSLHVSTSLLSAFMVWGRSKARFCLVLFWALAISISTMTTKQHYFVDVLSGAALALGAYWIFFHKLKLTWPAHIAPRPLLTNPA